MEARRNSLLLLEYSCLIIRDAGEFLLGKARIAEFWQIIYDKLSYSPRQPPEGLPCGADDFFFIIFP